jgi:hypothetical protein
MKKILLLSLNSASTLIMFAAILLIWASSSYAADGDVPDITMTVLESEEAAERVVTDIQLPEKASPVAKEHAAKGLNTANEARKRGREFGQERAEQAREHGKKNRGDHGPHDRPNPPGPPDHPEPPANPGGP